MAEDEEVTSFQRSRPALELKNVSKYFKDKDGNIVTAAENVSLSIAQGKVMALVGESGSGKTTVGRLSVGLDVPSAGQIFLGGVPLRSYKKSQLRRTAQYIHQDPYSALDPFLTVRELLSRPLLYVKGVNEPEQRENIMREMLSWMGLEVSLLDTSLRELSGGQKQRVLLARAFVIEPDYLVADEPTTMIDFVNRGEIMALISKMIRKSGTSVLLITHDMSVASVHSDDIAIMYKGEIVEYGMTREVLKNPLHPYTTALLSVTPDKLIHQSLESFAFKRGVVKIPANLVGCRYQFGCPYAFDRCVKDHPGVVDAGRGHMVACFKVDLFSD
jgi:peptide/nickel transport system ATP-binding protein